MKTRVVLLSFLLWILVVSVMFLFKSGVRSSISSSSSRPPLRFIGDEVQHRESDHRVPEVARNRR
ncbi:ribosomal protein S6 [Actinidia rufa]|uniref:Ribosomal protein S6 n=1 Tax=Actinidia rufa TaxID=165716 RepID=A0A7J0G2Z8_9ERIC|nr:ribosomal protein S6 [Actinidia rufa]